MGLFNKIFNKTNECEQLKHENCVETKKRSQSVSSFSPPNQKPHIRPPENIRKPSNPLKPNTSQTFTNGHRVNSLKRSMSTGQISPCNIKMKQFLDYWKNENLMMFYNKNDEGLVTNHSKYTESNKSYPLKSCFKKGALLDHKKRLLMCQQAAQKPSALKTKTNIAKLFSSKNCNNDKLNGSSNNSSSSLIPLKKWSSQPLLYTDKECEYDMLGMHDYYDNEANPLDDQPRRFSSNPLFSSDSDYEDETSDNGSFTMPIISPITSVDTESIEKKSFKDNTLTIPPGLENVNVPKHLHFDKTLFTIDPPQQICSKQPRVGEVEVQNGCVIVHKPSDSIVGKDVDGMNKGTQGLSVGGRGVLKVLTTEDRDNLEKSLKWRYFEDLKKYGRQDVKLKLSNVLKDELETNSDFEFESEDECFPDSTRKVSWKTIYQRVCHLREILPIVSIMQQIPEEEGDTADNEPRKYIDFIPLIILKNNKPSLIEILTLCDFISCSFIETINFDMCDLSVEMFGRIIDAVSTMITNIHQSLNSINILCVTLSFKNAPISEQGWVILCKFMSSFDFKNIKLSLDLSLSPQTKCNVLRKKNINCLNDKTQRMSLQLPVNKGKNITELNDFDYNMKSRENDWSLFIASIACNSSLKFKQLYINNTGIFSSNNEDYSSIVQNFFESVCVKTMELGASKYEIEDLENVAKKSKSGDLNGLPATKIAKCELLAQSLLSNLENKGVTKFNIKDLLRENKILEQPRSLPESSFSANKRNILIDHNLLDYLDGDNFRSFSLKGPEDEIVPLFLKSDSSDESNNSLSKMIKGSHEDLMKLNTTSIRDMIKH
ncbi:hypothetical protein QEN19_001547 [Hanseniaspora menglaensis]